MNTKAKILIVDDEAPMLFVIQHLLRAEGYQVSTATNGKAAIEIAAKHKFDLIITDLIMPRMDGIELILALRVTHPKTPVIAMSGGWNGGSQSYLRLAAMLGARQTLAKPFDKAYLLSAVETQIGKPQRLFA